jgi:hypothetical protein
LIRSAIHWPTLLAGAAGVLALTALFAWAGGLSPEELPSHTTSKRQVIGMSLMLILMPPYLFTSFLLLQRYSIDLVRQIAPQIPDESDVMRAITAIQGGFARTWKLSLVLGVTMGLFNAQLYYSLFESQTPRIDIPTSLIQMVLWIFIGFMLCQRFVAARAFSGLGEQIEFDLFRLDRLRLLARSGLWDVLAIMGAIALSPLQGLDAEFRWYNYAFAFAIAIPAALFLLFVPLRGLQRRIATEKARRLAQIESEIDASLLDGTSTDVVHLETLLAHRTRIRAHPTWPLRTALLSRLLAYLVIPPLAWIGAAIVERLIEHWVVPGAGH